MWMLSSGSNQAMVVHTEMLLWRNNIGKSSGNKLPDVSD